MKVPYITPNIMEVAIFFSIPPLPANSREVIQPLKKSRFSFGLPFFHPILCYWGNIPKPSALNPKLYSRLALAVAGLLTLLAGILGRGYESFLSLGWACLRLRFRVRGSTTRGIRVIIVCGELSKLWSLFGSLL